MTLVERLRDYLTNISGDGAVLIAASVVEEAADEIDLLRGIVRDVMSELLIAQENNQMSSAGYRGEWLGELIETYQRGLEKR